MRRGYRIGLWGLIGLLTPWALGADWPQFLGPTRNATSSETRLATTWPKDGPPRLWQVAAGDGYSGPVIADGLTLLFHRLEDREVVDAFDAATGKPRWTFAYPTSYRDDLGKGDGPRSTPLVAAGQVFTLGAEGRLTCLDLKTGKKIWDHDLTADYPFPKGFFGVATSPLVEGDRLLVLVGAPDAGIVAFDTATGKEAWKAAGHKASYASPLTATIDGVRHALFFTREGLVSLDPKSGAVRFSKPWRSRMNASVNAATPVVVGNEVFVSACYGTGALLATIRKDGVDEVWKGDESLSNHYDTSVYHDGYLYGIDGRQEQGARLRCVEWKTGNVKWTKDGFGCASLILADRQLVALTEEGDLVSLDAAPAGYRERARATVLKGPCRSPLALADGRLYGRDGKNLVCWDVRGP